MKSTNDTKKQHQYNKDTTSKQGDHSYFTYFSLLAVHYSGAGTNFGAIITDCGCCTIIAAEITLASGTSICSIASTRLLLLPTSTKVFECHVLLHFDQLISSISMTWHVLTSLIFGSPVSQGGKSHPENLRLSDLFFGVSSFGLGSSRPRLSIPKNVREFLPPFVYFPLFFGFKNTLPLADVGFSGLAHRCPLVCVLPRQRIRKKPSVWIGQIRFRYITTCQVYCKCPSTVTSAKCTFR